jgi:hypothetical protein
MTSNPRVRAISLIKGDQPVFRALHPTVAIAAILALPLAARIDPRQDAGVPAREEPVPRTDVRADIAKAQLKTARQALEMIRRSSELGAPIVNQPRDVHRWSTRLLGAQIYLSLPEDTPRTADPEVYFALATAAPTPERTTAFEDHLKRMRNWESTLRPLYERGILSALEFLEIQSHRLEAEFWLARERSREQKHAEKPSGRDP